MDYAQGGKWKFPFAPHDLGQYPLREWAGVRRRGEQRARPDARGRVGQHDPDAGGDGESGRQRELRRNKYWPLLTRWAAYLRDKGLDPENQLCTDDFAGHLAHNTNLSLKAIEALGGYALLADMTGHKDEAQSYRKTAQEFAARWQTMASAGDHYKLTFDGKDETWSQKYNLVWDKILGLNLFPASVTDTEIAYYKAHQNKYGLPLDNRKSYTKLDWTLWSATLAPSGEDFRALVVAALRLVERHALPRPAHRLVRDDERQGGRLSGSLGRGRAGDQDAGRSRDVAQVGRPRRNEIRSLTRRKKESRRSLEITRVPFIAFSAACPRAAVYSKYSNEYTAARGQAYVPSAGIASKEN